MNSNKLVVQKFGGSSLATPDKIRRVAELVTGEKKTGRDVIVVVSAMGNTTDQLVELARSISPSPPKRELDMLLTAGERISMALLSMAISRLGFQAISFTGSQSGIVTDTSHTMAKIMDVKAFRVRDELEKGRIVIVAGFQGVSPAKEVTTLGRGGSDTTCVALAAAFDAQECDIFTDVDGVYTANPRLVPEARKIPRISYEEMLELSFCGAEVLHWRSVDVARRFGVRVHVRSSEKKEAGTIVTGKDEIETADICGITQDMGLVELSFGGADPPAETAERALAALDKGEVIVKLMRVLPGQGESGQLSVMIPEEQRKQALTILAAEAGDMEVGVDDTLATVSIVGHGLCSKPGIARKVLASLSSARVTPLSITTSGITLTILMKRSEALDAVKKLHSDLM
ncbi:aspartate kinase [Candidatus Eisenbacteria bacterium]|uniref:Aspartokinase n=1 Tax=Eiseniibacteriota bacterium TaxID=2212470 RepID=A0ABV6YNU0_UNCEI